MKDTFHLWALQDRVTKEITWVGGSGESREGARACKMPYDSVVKLECRIVQPKRKPKRGKYPNDNFGLPAGYTPHNPDKLARKHGKRYGVYQCPHCNGYHLTTKLDKADQYEPLKYITAQ